MSFKPSTRLIKQAKNSVSDHHHGSSGSGHHPNFSLDSSSSSSSSSLITKKLKDDIEKIQQDLLILNQKIAESKGEASSLPSSSSSSTSQLLSSQTMPSSNFVSGIRSVTESERRSSSSSLPGSSLHELKDSKISTLEIFLEKIIEYDRLVLIKTTPTDSNGNNPPKRRKSFGNNDLSTLPTHFTIIDRLVDLYNTSKRVTVIRQTVTPPTSTTAKDSNTNNTPTTSYVPPSSHQHSSTHKSPDKESIQQIESLKSQLTKLQQKYDISETKRIEMENQHTFLIKDNEALQKKLNSFQSSQTNQEKALLDELTQWKQQSSTLQEKLEIEISYNQRILNILMNKVQAIKDEKDSLFSSDEKKVINNAEYQNMVSFISLYSCYLYFH
jgi:hypothetical protein